MDHDMASQVTKDDSAWVEVSRAKADLEAFLGRCQPGRPLLDGPMIRGLIGGVLAHLDTAQELHSEHRHTHTVTIPPMIRQDGQGHVYQVAGGAMSLVDAIQAGLVQVVALKTEEPPPGEAVYWTAPLEGPKP